MFYYWVLETVKTDMCKLRKHSTYAVITDIQCCKILHITLTFTCNNVISELSKCIPLGEPNYIGLLEQKG